MENVTYLIPREFCGAKTRTGGRCKQPAMANGRCRLHGGKSLSGKQHGRYKHGHFTRAAKEERKRLAALLREISDTMDMFEAQHRITEEINRCSTIRGHRTIAKIILKGKENLL